MNLADALARLHGVGVRSSGYVARCPAHDDRRPSLSLRQSDCGVLLIKCFAGCSFERILEALQESQELRIPRMLSHSPALTIARRADIVKRIWSESRPIAGTLGQKYLNIRGINIADLPLRFHPKTLHPSGIFAPALIGPVDNSDGSLVAIHRTFLANDGCSKAALNPARMALGPIAGNAVRLARAGETLALAEGIETALSIYQATDTATWATLGTANLPNVDLPEIVREVIICADIDKNGAGERAAQAAAQGFLRAGRRVRIARPTNSKDFNEMRL